MSEYHGDRLRFILGDLSMGEEPNHELSVSLCFDGDGEFSEFGPTWPKNWKDVTHYKSHCFMVQLWRWGLYLSVRGRAVR